MILFIQNFIGTNFDVNTKKFISNYNKQYVFKQYNLYLEQRKNKEIFIVPSLTIPPRFLL